MIFPSLAASHATWGYRVSFLGRKEEVDAPPAAGGRQRARRPTASRVVKTTLPSSAVSSRLAREVARDVLPGPEDQRVALVVTELVTNSVKHAGAAPELTLDWDGRVLRVEVYDEGEGRPVLRDPDVTSTSGRGLALVDAVADRWGVEDRRPGKVVWAELDLQSPGAQIDLAGGEIATGFPAGDLPGGPTGGLPGGSAGGYLGGGGALGGAA
jgi:anti-sigma regulatory factor (Ser/Thr protein kinase)